MDRRTLTRALLTTSLTGALAALVVACGDEDTAAEPDLSPRIVELTPECGPSTDPQRYDGQVLVGVQVTVDDPDGDAAFVTIAIGASVFRVDDFEEGEGTEVTFTYTVPDDDTSLLRCEPGMVIMARVEDEAGHVTEDQAELIE